MPENYLPKKAVIAIQLSLQVAACHHYLALKLQLQLVVLLCEIFFVGGAYVHAFKDTVKY